MDENSPYTPQVLKTPKDAGTVGADFAPTLFYPVTLECLKYLRGMFLHLDNDKFWIGTPEEVRTARQIIREQASVPVMTKEQICGSSQTWGAEFRFSGNVIEARQGVGLPEAPWTFQTEEQEDGGKLVEYKSIEEGQ